MKEILVISTFFAVISAHYTFPFLLVNGTQSGRWEYVRDVTCSPTYCHGFPPGDEFGKAAPNYQMNNTAMRCGFDAELAANKTETATVVAGSEIGFRIATDIQSAFTRISHAGPAQVYLSRSSDLSTDLGDGSFFKIASLGPLNDTYWKVWVPPSTDVNFTIPLNTPPGTYLLRIEHIYVDTGFGFHQFYVNCAHVNIVGSGGGTPSELIKFPEGYKEDDPGIWVRNGMTAYTGLDKYVAPGPPVWKG